MKVEKLECLEGVKVIACWLVFNFHFTNLFYPGLYSLLPEHFVTTSLEYIIGSTPLNLFVFGGKFGVKVFMLLSGFFVGYRFFITGDKKSLKSGALKKYFRLVFPILVVNILIFFAMFLGLYANKEAAISLGAGAELFMSNYNTFAPNLFMAIKEAIWGCFAAGVNQYNGPLWFIYYEFFGTLLMAAILALVGESKARYMIYALASLLLLRTDFLPIDRKSVV